MDAMTMAAASCAVLILRFLEGNAQFEATLFGARGRRNGSAKRERIFLLSFGICRTMTVILRGSRAAQLRRTGAPQG
jgi:hypothetical protein